MGKVIPVCLLFLEIPTVEITLVLEVSPLELQLVTHLHHPWAMKLLMSWETRSPHFRLSRALIARRQLPDYGGLFDIPFEVAKDSIRNKMQ